MAATAGRRPELADILAAHAPPLERLSRDRRRAIRDIVLCRTAMLGGHVQVCDSCGATKTVYHSCRNRHGVGEGRGQIPPRRDTGVDRSASHLDADHALHPHLHCIVTGGGLSLDRARWIGTRPTFFLPVRVLSRVFKGKLLERFEAAVTSRSLSTPETFAKQCLRRAASTPWVVYSKAPMAGPDQVLRYLSRYSHRVAIGNERIVAFHDGEVAFRYRDRRRGNRSGVLTLPATDFVQRFLLHTLPSRFVRIRHYGLLANGQRTALVARARALFGPPAPPEPVVTTAEDWRALYQRLTGRDPELCAVCHVGRVRIAYALDPAPSPRGP